MSDKFFNEPYTISISTYIEILTLEESYGKLLIQIISCAEFTWQAPPSCPYFPQSATVALCSRLNRGKSLRNDTLRKLKILYPLSAKAFAILSILTQCRKCIASGGYHFPLREPSDCSNAGLNTITKSLYREWYTRYKNICIYCSREHTKVLSSHRVH